jgi:hypothetical protein
MRAQVQLSRKFAVVAAVAIVCVFSGAAMAANKLIVKGTDGTTDAFVVTDTGNVGIGGSAPIYPIQIRKGGATAATTLEFNNTGNSTYNQYDAPQIQLIRNNISSVNDGIPYNNDRLGAFQFGTYFGTQVRYAAAILANADSASWSASSYPGSLTFLTSSSSSTYPIERLKITSAGNVGIGTTTPVQRLEVNGGVRLNTATTKPTCNSSNRGTLWFTRASTGEADTLEVCAKGSDENYAWRSLF